MFALNPVILLVKPPVPLPFVVFELLVVGLVDVLQQTPLVVTVAPPSEVTFPPQTALDELIDETEFVVTVGVLPLLSVVKLLLVPYDVPLLLVA